MSTDQPPKGLGTRTAAVHAGEFPDPVSGASGPPIVMASTFVTDRPQGFSAYELTDESPYIYTRWANPTVRMLEEKVAALEGAEAAAAFGSGMAAASAILLTELSAGDHVVLSDVCYAGIAELGHETLPRLGIAVSRVDASDPANVAAAMRPETKLVLVDSPANPILRLTDIAAVAEVAHAGGARLAVDSTFATPIATRPLELGADYVFHSLTKYIGGHGDAVGGIVCGATALIRRLVIEAAIHHGGVLSPFNAWLIARGAATLPLRMRAHEETALAVARWLEAHPRVARVNYPGLESHPQHDLARRQMRNFSGMLSFQIRGTEADGTAIAERMAKELRIIHYAVSLGHHRSLIVWMPTKGMIENSFRLSGDQAEAYRAWAGEGLFRLSVGIEDAEDLIADLDRVL